VFEKIIMKEEGRGKKEEGRGKREEGRSNEAQKHS
jgi:hypothetical protein